MSRVGKKPIKIEKGVEVKIDDKKILVKGPKGEISFVIPEYINVEITGEEIIVHKAEKYPSKFKKQVQSLWGTVRALINNMIIGVSKGFEKKLQLEGIGYKASLEGKDLVLNVGFSHPVKIACPEGVQFSVEKNVIIVSGIDKQKVGQAAASIRAVRKPEPYKGKGIRYVGEQVRRKLGKKAVGAGA